MSLPSLSLKGQVAVITGGRQGLGKDIAMMFGEAGANIVVCDKVIEDGRLASVVREIPNLGRRSLGLQTDVSRKADVDHLVQSVMDEFGRIDILVNNAGITSTLPLLEQNEDLWDAIIDVNLKGTYLFSLAVSKIMIKQEKGNIINMVSCAGLSQGFGNAYGISKAGIIKMTRILAFELGKHNVRVNAIAPGWVETEIIRFITSDPVALKGCLAMIPMGQMGQPGDIANAALFLASEASSYVTGHTLVVDGGLLA
jgi:NAD(P)-dependent dehydrogenase (short-subunit alcohol dehydrogenase family)